MLADGEYDVFVVDATPLADGDEAAGWSLDLTIVAGDHKGDVVTVNSEGLRGSEMDLLGMPATLTVADGAPTVRIDT